MQIELKNIISGAITSCPHFCDTCNKVKYDPQTGFMPRGFGGAEGAANEVRLVLVTAEPADPADGEHYSGNADQLFDQQRRVFQENMLGLLKRSGRASPFHKNLRRIAELFWPDLDEEVRWRRTWYTNTVLCSAAQSGGRIAAPIEKACVDTYLKKQLDLFKGAYIVVLGGKARDRMTRMGLHFDTQAQHPSARPNNSRESSWVDAAKQFDLWRSRRPY